MSKVTIGVVNYNGLCTLPDMLRSIHGLTYPDFEVVVVDNCSTDGSREWLQSNVPEVRCIYLDANLGLPGARNVILREAQSDYIFLLDNDIVLEPQTLCRLMNVMSRVPTAAACHAEILDKEHPDVGTHYNGGWVHYLCAHIPRTYPKGERPEYESFDVVSGGALLVNRQYAQKVGNFDEDFFFNWEDGDFTARLTLAGYLCLNIPHAIVYHPAKPRGTSMVYFQVRNRWYFILKLFAWRTLLLIWPMLVLYEIAQILIVATNGAISIYCQGTVAAIHDLPQILRKRKAFQKLKVKRDREWLRSGVLYIPPVLMNHGILYAVTKLAFHCFDCYWAIVRRFC